MAHAAKLTPTYPLAIGDWTFPGYTALYTVVLNLVVAIVLTPLFRGLARRSEASDETSEADYHPAPRAA